MNKEKLKKIKELLDKYGLEGQFSGGNDSGGIDTFQFAKHNDNVDDEALLREFEDYVYTHSLGINYGGWSGNFYASGSITYEDGVVSVSGEDFDEENMDTVAVKEFNLKNYFTKGDASRIDSVGVYVSENDSVTIRINLRNGPWTESLQKSEEKLTSDLVALDKDYPSDIYRYYTDNTFAVDEIVEVDINKPKISSIGYSIHLYEKIDDKELTEVESD